MSRINVPFQICGVDVSTEDGPDRSQRSPETSEHHCGLFKGPGRVHQEVRLFVALQQHCAVAFLPPDVLTVSSQACDGTELRSGERQQH